MADRLAQLRVEALMKVLMDEGLPEPQLHGTFDGTAAEVRTHSLHGLGKWERASGRQPQGRRFRVAGPGGEPQEGEGCALALHTRRFVDDLCRNNSTSGAPSLRIFRRK